MKYAMVVNYAYCTGCESCVVSCRKERELPLDEWGIKVEQIGSEKLEGKWEWDYVPVPSSLCNRCENRIAKGMKPLCELHCLANVIRVVPFDEMEKTAGTMEGKTVVYMGAVPA